MEGWPGVMEQGETALGCMVYDVDQKDMGYDLTSLDLQPGGARLVEANGLDASCGIVLLAPGGSRATDDRRAWRRPYATANRADALRFAEPILDLTSRPAREGGNLPRYQVRVDAVAHPVLVRERLAEYNANGGTL